MNSIVLEKEVATFEKEYMDILNQYIEVFRSKAEKEAARKHSKAKKVVEFIGGGGKVTEAERHVDADNEIYGQKQEIISLEAEEKGLEFMLKLYQAKANFLNSLILLQKREGDRI